MKAKRATSLLLAVAMTATLITAVPVSAFAKDEQGGAPYSNNVAITGQMQRASPNSIIIENVGAVTYNGMDHTPHPIITTLDGTVLTENVDYALSYQNNRNAGQAAILVTGIGVYADVMQTVQFDINRAPIRVRVNDVRCAVNETPVFSYTVVSGRLYGGDQFSEPQYSLYGKTGSSKGITVRFDNMPNYDIQVTDGTLTYTEVSGNVTIGAIQDTIYNGRSQTPEPTITSADGYNLIKGADYILTYSNNLNAGQASVKVTGIGRYAGILDKTIYFEIKKAPLVVQVNDVKCSIRDNPQYSYFISSGTLFGADSLGTPVYSTTSKTGHSYGPVFDINAKFPGANVNYALTVRAGTMTYTDVDYDRYFIDADSSAGGSISPSGHTLVDWGEDQIFRFYPYSGYEIAAVYVDGRNIGAVSSYTFYDVLQNHSIYVEFEHTSTVRYEIDVSCSFGGSISPSGNVWVNRGSSKTFTFTPNSGYKITGVYVDGVKVSSTATRYTFSSVYADHTLYVEFERTTPSNFAITSSASSGGRISPSGTSSVTRGTNKTYTFTANSGYGVLAVYVDGSYVGDSSSYTFSNVTDDHEIYVRFAKRAEIKNEYDIDVSWNTGGTVSPNGQGTVSVTKGNDRTFTFTPQSGYRIARIYVDGEYVPSGFSYTFKDVVEDHTLRVEFEKSGAVLVYPTNWRNPFTDVHTGDWFYESVKFMNGNGLIQGVTATTYAPKATTTRAMIVTILYRLDGAPIITGGNPFYDVSANAYYADAIAWAAKYGIVSGHGGGAFRPNDPITREQMAAILYRYASYRGYDISRQSELGLRYADYHQISSYAVVPMSWAHANGIITGTTSNLLSPNLTATRAEIATMLARFCQKFCM